MPTPHTWDIFCRVVDNYGDIGVCWRLARQLVHEHGKSVRLWVDNLASLHALWPNADPASECQLVDGVEVRRWEEPFPQLEPADAVIEAFGCGLPDAYAEALAKRAPQPLWMVLEYMSAEPWVTTHHGLPSPHPRWPVTRQFIFPGFEAGTGGLLREAGLAARRDAFDAAARRRYWESLGFASPADGSTVVSLFAYDSAPVGELLAAWERGAEFVVTAVPQGKVTPAVLEHFGGQTPAAGRTWRRGNLEARLLPFLPQPRYDELLWACDCNFVRGEDSFVRAQWAARALVWQIYPQQDAAHARKLDAFLDLYCADLPQASAAAMRGMWRAWNGMGAGGGVAGAWQAFRGARVVLDLHARAWAKRLAAHGDLAARLAQPHPDGLK